MLTLSQQLLERILDHAQNEYPKEACGILAGRNGAVVRAYPMKNSERSSATYLMDPREQFEVFKKIRKADLQLSAIYHSHVASKAYPSARDRELAFYPEAAYVIVSLMNQDLPEVKAYRIRNGEVEEEKIKIV